MRQHLQATVAALAIMGGAPAIAAAQNDRITNVAPYVYHERILARFPLPYFGAKRPDPPVSGYYAWRLAFGDDSNAVVVLRTDSAVATTNNKQLVRSASLYLCSKPDDVVLDCHRKASGTARMSQEIMELEITEPAVVMWVRTNRPQIVVRELFEPEGRFRVDLMYVIYNAGKPTLTR